MFITDKLRSLAVHPQVIYTLNRHDHGSVCLTNLFASTVCLEVRWNSRIDIRWQPEVTALQSDTVDKKLSWCWQTCATRLEVSQHHQTQYHSIC